MCYYSDSDVDNDNAKAIGNDNAKDHNGSDGIQSSTLRLFPPRAHPRIRLLVIVHLVYDETCVVVVPHPAVPLISSLLVHRVQPTSYFVSPDFVIDRLLLLRLLLPYLLFLALLLIMFETIVADQPLCIFVLVTPLLLLLLLLLLLKGAA